LFIELIVLDVLEQAGGVSERGTPYEGQRPPPSGRRSGERRVALVIGNSAYAHTEALWNPVNDAEAMARVLARLGFDVVKGIDVDLRARLGQPIGVYARWPVSTSFDDMLPVGLSRSHAYIDSWCHSGIF